ncbi:MAG: ThuA domain-containing protein, partial [Chitinophagia bacterium]|nr:ThuA domain-containing protein [Chitinophagia bacterium]
MRKIRIVLITALVSATVTGIVSWMQPAPQPRILVFSKTAGFRHASIPAGIAAIRKLGAENGFAVDTTENAAYFQEDSLKRYSAVVFLNATGDVLNAYQQAEFERYIQAGGGYMGIHAAADCEYGWPWYGKLVGGYFKSHPRIQPARLQVVDRSHASTKHLPEVWERSDEWYNFRKAPDAKDVTILIRIDEKSYQGGENGGDHPMAWYHSYDGGRAYYTEFGHTDESYADPLYLKHILGGIQYAIGENRPLDYKKARSMRVPDEDRFSKNMLVSGVFDEPTEMAILPNLDIIVVQRKGGILRYDAKTKKIAEAGNLLVYHKASVKGVNAEEGLMGIAAD